MSEGRAHHAVGSMPSGRSKATTPWLAEAGGGAVLRCGGLPTMRFSICVMADIEEIGFFSHAETLGYDSVWVTDSQMLFSDCYAVLALAAQQNRRLRLGPGVALWGMGIPAVPVAPME